MAVPSTSELLKLDVQTRLALIDELWDSVVNDVNDPDKQALLPVSEHTRSLLDERLREYRADPSIALPWDDIHAELRKLT